MKSFLLIVTLLVGSLSATAYAATYEGEGAVESADPLYARITIRHGNIKDFAGAGTTEFFVASPELLRNIARKDLIKFTVADDKGNVAVTAIEKTGVEPPAEPAKLGQIIQETLQVTGDVAKGITEPLPPAHEVVSAAAGATTDATGAVLEGAAPDAKSEF
ncbi:MAG: hypothetical protein MOGMAGMI_01017 [Candidatus Omnitrophica bacterium]|nr:hypothetical protein [Candidatus Omnitrophota bacterium]